MMWSSTVILSLVGLASPWMSSAAAPHQVSLAQLKERVDEFFDNLNEFAASPTSGQSCTNLVESFEDDATVTVAGTEYTPEDLRFLFCDYIPRVMETEDLQVEVQSVDETRGNVVGNMVLSGVWIETGNQFKDVELFWRLEPGNEKIQRLDLIPVNPAEFQEATLSPAMCSARQLMQSFMEGGDDLSSMVHPDATLEAPNLYAFRPAGDKQPQTEWSADEAQDFKEQTLGIFNWTEAKMSEFQVIDSSDTNYIAVITFANLTTAQGNTALDDLQFWINMQFNDTEGNSDSQPASANANANANANGDNDDDDEDGQTSFPCDNAPKLTGLRLLLSRPLQMRDLIDLRTMSEEDGQDDKNPDDKNRQGRAGLQEGDEEDQGELGEEDEKEEMANNTDADAEKDDADKDEEDMAKNTETDADKDEEDSADGDDDKEAADGDEDDDKEGADGDDDEEDGEEYIVEAEKTFFSQPNLEIAPGETVTFVNLGDGHRVIEVKSLKSTPEDTVKNGFDSGDEEELVVSFDEPGTHYYLDEANYKGGMRGVIRVVEEK